MVRATKKLSGNNGLIISIIFMFLAIIVFISPILYTYFSHISYGEKGEAEIISVNLHEVSFGARGPNRKMIYYHCLLRTEGIRINVTDFEAGGEMSKARFRVGDLILVNYSKESLSKGQSVIAGFFSGVMIP